MSGARPLIGPLVLIALVALFAVSNARGGAADGQVAGGQVEGARYASPAALPAPSALRFDDSIADSDRQVVRQVIAQARPQARRLVELVAGLVTISVATPRAGVAGEARPSGDGYAVTLDLGGVSRSSGMRGIRRLVLHELAHVVDHALVGRALEARLDAATPPGFGCDDGLSGGCAVREERFAESFAKWATGDIGSDLYIGYRVPPPSSLSGWGDPLAAITR